MRILEPSFNIIYAPPYSVVLEVLEHEARKAYKSEDKIGPGTAERLIRTLLSKKPTAHESVIEHMGFTVDFIYDRGLSHEKVRHRLCSPTQESTRYCNYGKDRFGNEISVVPMLDGLTEAQISRRKKLYEESERVYLAEITEGISPQQARDNLPFCLKTDIGITANMREWRHIMRLRTHKSAHPQMRKIMRKLLVWCRETYPVLFESVGYLTDEEC
jgi:thymidylate synthase (FAD)